MSKPNVKPSEPLWQKIHEHPKLRKYKTDKEKFKALLARTAKESTPLDPKTLPKDLQDLIAVKNRHTVELSEEIADEFWNCQYLRDCLTVNQKVGGLYVLFNESPKPQAITQSNSQGISTDIQQSGISSQMTAKNAETATVLEVADLAGLELAFRPDLIPDSVKSGRCLICDSGFDRQFNHERYYFCNSPKCMKATWKNFCPQHPNATITRSTDSETEEWRCIQGCVFTRETRSALPAHPKSSGILKQIGGLLDRHPAETVLKILDRNETIEKERTAREEVRLARELEKTRQIAEKERTRYEARRGITVYWDHNAPPTEEEYGEIPCPWCTKDGAIRGEGCKLCGGRGIAYEFKNRKEERYDSY